MSEVTGEARFSRTTVIRIGVGVLLLAALFLAGRQFLSMQAALAALLAIDAVALVPILGLGAVYYVLKALRWHYFLGYARIDAPVHRSVAAYLAGQWFTFTPAGEFMRAYLLAGQEKFAAVAPTVVVQAWIDIVSLALMGTLAIAVFPSLAPIVLPVTLPLLLGVGVIVTPGVRRLLAALPPVRWLSRRYSSTKWGAALASLVRLLRFRPIALGLLYSLPIVGVGAGALFLAVRAIELMDVDFLQAYAAYCMLYLLGGISPLPQGLGVAESSGTFYFSYLGVDPTTALIAVLLFRAAMLSLSALIGLIAFFWLRWVAGDTLDVSVRGGHAPWSGGTPGGSAGKRTSAHQHQYKARRPIRQVA